MHILQLLDSRDPNHRDSHQFGMISGPNARWCTAPGGRHGVNRSLSSAGRQMQAVIFYACCKSFLQVSVQLAVPSGRSVKDVHDGMFGSPTLQTRGLNNISLLVGLSVH